MESELSLGFKAAVARWLRAKGLEVDEVTAWDEYTPFDAGCDTCGYGASPHEVTIYYFNKEGPHRYVHYGLFSELLMELLDA